MLFFQNSLITYKADNMLHRLDGTEMKVAYVGNIINHGFPLAAWGTGFLITLSEQPVVESVEVFCPEKDVVEQPVRYPPNLVVRPLIEYGNPFSVLSVIESIRHGNYDIVIFNLNATSLGDRNLLNLMVLAMPWIVSRLLRIKTFLIYHSSVLTTDIKRLGYNSWYNQIRMSIVKSIEALLFSSVDTYVLLKLYKTKIDHKIKRNKVHFLSIAYVEAIPTLFFNYGNEIPGSIAISGRSSGPIILLHGFWGPQKNLELALESLDLLRKEGFKFKVILSGGINPHFTEYLPNFESIVKKYDGVIDELRGFVNEKEILNLFEATDLLLLPYKVAGGHSGVLEIGFFFETNVICVTHPEYDEKRVFMNKFLSLVDEQSFVNAVREAITNWRPSSGRSVDAATKLHLLGKCISTLIDPLQHEKGNIDWLEIARLEGQ